MENNVISFHGEQSVKDKLINRLELHYAADEIVKGQYWENGKGCAIGCATHRNNGSHDEYQKQWGICWQLALIQDSIFENLPNEMAKEWPLRFTKALQPGKDTLIALNKFVLWNLADTKEGLMAVLKDGEEKDALKEVVALYTDLVEGKEVPQKRWREVADKYAYASAYASAYAYAYASAYASAYAYAYAYASASASASASAYAYASASAYASAYAVSKTERIVRMSEKMLEILAEL